MADDIEQIRLRMYDAALRAIEACARDLLGRAQRDAPIDTGALRASGMVHDPEANPPHGATVRVSFNRVYAAAQEVGYATMHSHGRTWEWQARQHPRGGRSRYLGSNLEAMAARYEALIGAAVKRELER